MQKRKMVKELRTTGRKIFAGVLGAVILLASVPVSADNINEEEGESCSKISEKLQDKMSQLYTEGKSEEKLPVYIWYQDIDQEAVERETEEQTGVNRMELDTLLDVDVEEMIISGTEAEKQEYLEEKEQQREEVSELTDTFIIAQRENSRESYEKQYQDISKRLEIEDTDVMYRSRYAPMVIAQMTCGEIERLEQREEVEDIDLYEEVEVKPESNIVINEGVKWRTDTCLQNETAKIQKTGLTGKRSLVGVLEDGIPYDGEDFREMHEDILCGIISTLAPSAYIYCTHMEGESGSLGFYEQTENLIDMGLHVINLSWGKELTENDMYGRWDQWLDHLSSNNAVTFVTSAGNGNLNQRITCPGGGYNIITVGNVNGRLLNNTCGNYQNGCFKPDVVAQGDYGDLGSGTSYSAAYVTGTIALMLELNPALAAHPQAIKAILMAGCFTKAVDEQGNTTTGSGNGNELRKGQGAGIVNILNILSIVKYKQYDIGYMPASINETDILFKEPVYGASTLNVSLAWIRNVEASGIGSSSILTPDTRQDMDLYLYDGNTQVAKSMVSNSSTEMVSYNKLNNNSLYKIKVKRYTSSAEPVYYAYAWATDSVAEDYEYRLPSDVYWIKNYQSGYYLDFNNSLGENNTIQYTYHGNGNQQWILQKSNGSSVLKNNMGYGYGCLGKGNTIDSKWSYAKVSNTSTPITLKWDTYNKTGAYFLIKESDQTALEPNNGQTTLGSPVAWRKKSVVRDTQRWYLEKINYRKGDVDGDGVIALADLTKMNQYISGLSGLSGLQQYLADLNNDGKIDAQDRTILNNMLNN